MPVLTASVLAGFGSALIVLGGYHFLVAAPRLRGLRALIDVHDNLLSGGAAEPASQRILSLEGAAASADREVGLQAERIAALERVARSETPHIGFVRYNAFDDVGSDQSYALALLTGEGDGVVLSSIYSREETRTYGKAVQKFQTSQEASAEERSAIAQAKAARIVTNNAFLIKIIPPEGYDVYRLHFSRTAAIGVVLAVVVLVGAALGAHAWQLHVAEDDVRALQATTAAQNAKLRAIDHQADALAGQLRDIQRQDAEIRKLLGVGDTPAAPPRATHGFVPAAGAPSADRLAARLARLVHVSQVRLSDSRSLDRLAHRVLNLRRLALLARERMIAALPSLNPVAGTISAGYGWRVNPWPEFHRGLDLAADYGTPVRAAADGVVRSAGWDDGGFGIKVDVDHENGYHTWYAHLSRVAVTPGERVRKGETIAFVGATGEATGPHLHYQVMLSGQAIDPAPYLNGVPAKVLATLPAAERVQ